MQRLQRWKSLLEPRWISAICAGSLIFALVLDGSLLTVYKLDRQHSEISHKIRVLQGQREAVQRQLEMVKNPKVLARQARNRFDLVGENDLIFVFAD